jgi:hypothetical protein
MKQGDIVRFQERPGAQRREVKIASIENGLATIWVDSYGGLWTKRRVVSSDRLKAIRRKRG